MVSNFRLLLSFVREELQITGRFTDAMRFLSKVIARKLIGPGAWKPTRLNEAMPASGEGEGIAFVFHLFYPDYLDRVQKVVANFPKSHYFVSTTSEEIARKTSELFRGLEVPVAVRIVPNVGRNFGPLFVEFSKELREFPFFVHLHTKRSTFLDYATANVWSDRLWQTLGENKNILLRVLHLMRENESLKIAYPDVSDLIAPINFRMGNNRSPATDLLEKASLSKRFLLEGSFAFPAGGMFLARTSAIEPILQAKLTYSDFPDELGQRDATPQHALERLIGVLAQADGGEHLVYLPTEDFFTVETSYVKRR